MKLTRAKDLSSERVFSVEMLVRVLTDVGANLEKISRRLKRCFATFAKRLEVVFLDLLPFFAAHLSVDTRSIAERR